MSNTSKLLTKLISFKTLSKNFQENKKSLRWIKSQLKSLPLYFNEVNINGFPSLIATTQKTKKPKVMLVAHNDIVDAPDRLFKLKKRAGKLIGRGVFDMKYATTAYINLFQSLKSSLRAYDLGMMITTDEELGGHNGVSALLKHGFKPQVAFLPDGGFDFAIEGGAKGIYQVTVKSTGKSAHGSRPWAGVNAIEQLLKFLLELENEFPKEPCEEPNHKHNTLNIGNISGGGESVNKIPDVAEAQLDIRFTPPTTKAKIKKVANDVKKNYPGITITELNAAAPYEINKKNKYQKIIRKIISERAGVSRYIYSHGTCDARHFYDAEVPCVVFRPIGGGHHSLDEWVDAKSLDVFDLILKNFVEQTAK